MERRFVRLRVLLNWRILIPFLILPLRSQDSWVAVQPGGYGYPVKIWLDTAQDVRAVHFTLENLPNCLEFDSLVTSSLQEWEVTFLDAGQFPQSVSVSMTVDEFSGPLNTSSQKICEMVYRWDTPCGGSMMELSGVSFTDADGIQHFPETYNNPFCDRLKADLNDDLSVDVLDIILYVVQYIFSNPPIQTACEAWALDFNDMPNFLMGEDIYFIEEPPYQLQYNVLEIVYLVGLILGVDET